MDANGQNQTRLTDNDRVGRVSLLVSGWTVVLPLCLTADGNSEIYVMDADGQNQIRLTDNYNGWGFSLSWSPDVVVLPLHPCGGLCDGCRWSKPDSPD